MDLIRKTKITTSSIMMKDGGSRPVEIQEPSCLVESMVEIMQVSPVSLGKDKEIRQHVFSIAYWKKKTKNVLGSWLAQR